MYVVCGTARDLLRSQFLSFFSSFQVCVRGRTWVYPGPDSVSLSPSRTQLCAYVDFSELGKQTVS